MLPKVKEKPKKIKGQYWTECPLKRRKSKKEKEGNSNQEGESKVPSFSYDKAMYNDVSLFHNQNHARIYIMTLVLIIINKIGMLVKLKAILRKPMMQLRLSVMITLKGIVASYMWLKREGELPLCEF